MIHKWCRKWHTGATDSENDEERQGNLFYNLKWLDCYNNNDRQ